MKKIYRIGCVGLLSDLPLLIAQAKGFFAEEGETVELTIELGWASIEAKLSSGQLTAANLPAVMPLALAVGKGKVPLLLRALAPTSYAGDALVLTPALAAAVKESKRPSAEPIRIGVESPYTQATLFAQTWLKQTAPSFQASTTLVPLSISQLIAFLNDGYIQGFCCSEPLGQIALQSGLGTTVARSRDYFPFHLHSVVAVQDVFCAREERAAQAMAAAIERARIFCADPAHHREVLQILLQCKSSFFTSSELPRALNDNPTSLRDLIGFEPRESVDGRVSRDPLEILIKACRALPGAEPPEAEVRREAKRIFHPLSETVKRCEGEKV